MAEASQILVEPYGKAGPFGEVLWYLLSEVRTRFIREWAMRIHDLGANQASEAIQALRKNGIAQCEAFLKKLEDEQSVIREMFRDTWVWLEDVQKNEDGPNMAKLSPAAICAPRIRLTFQNSRHDRDVLFE